VARRRLFAIPSLNRLSFPSIKAIMIIFLNELDNHSHFDSMKHSKGYISEAEHE